MKIIKLHQNGFTLLELMLVIGILVIIATISRDFYGSFVPSAQLEDNAKTIIYDLRNTRDKAMNGQDSRLWGIHFVNGVSDYYEIFSTPTDYNDATKTILVTNYLRNGIIFSSPAEGSNLDIIFSSISGQVASSSVTIKTGALERTVFVKEQGLIN
jgi:prepilin-type N-terminal cleavage/methylation domain